MERVPKKVESQFEMQGDIEPSRALIQEAFEILQREAVTHIAWERCSSRRAEVRGPRSKVDPGLQLTSDGIFKQAEKVGPTADVSGELRWEDAMRRRGLAMDIAGLMDYEVHTQWLNKLRAAISEPAEHGYKRVSWSQVLQADLTLFDVVDSLCTKTTRQVAGERITEFQRNFVIAMTSRKVERALEQREGTSLPAAASPASASIVAHTAPQPAARLDRGGQQHDEGRLQRQLQAAREENQGLKRKLQNMKDSDGDRGKGGGKRGGARGARGDRGKGDKKDLPPNALRRASADDGSRICWNFNRQSCNKCQPGQACNLGKHVCLVCAPDATHACHDATCPKKRQIFG